MMRILTQWLILMGLASVKKAPMMPNKLLQKLN